VPLQVTSWVLAETGSTGVMRELAMALQLNFSRTLPS